MTTKVTVTQAETKHEYDVGSPRPAEGRQRVIARLKDDEQLSVSAGEA